MDRIRVAGAQINLTVGDLAGNEIKILAAMEQAESAGADVLLFPELAITGYPPEDLLIRQDFVADARRVLDRIAAASGPCAVVVGFPREAVPEDTVDAQQRTLHNSAAVLQNGAVIATYDKVLLPSYGVFDESRYFAAGDCPNQLIEIAGVPVGVSICEDGWVEDGPPTQQADAGAKLMLNINASPFHHGKAVERQELMASRARGAGVPLVYLNLVGGQDELVFDGSSMVLGGDGELLARSPQFEEEFLILDVPVEGAVPRATGDSIAGIVTPPLDDEQEMYAALVLGLRDYVGKNGFTEVVIGLSGGIDSAVTAAIAVDALGADAVRGITMPSGFSSEHSVSDSRSLAENFGIRLDEIAIGELFGEFQTALSDVFEGTEFNVAEENVQARIRGVLLMAVSNKFGPMVVTTGNKSEVAVGYATLYGDMAGGFSVLKDVFKMDVYRLARWRNRNGEMIPSSTISKPPSAELRPDQMDSDSLPPYELLDAILERYVEDDRSVASIAEEGFDIEIVRRICGLVDRNEYKRRQAAPGVRITAKAFGKDRRLPITNRYRGGTS
jgi:NAD+ synthase (glutamine-hydrolysing)